jgi:hypothetical protein
MGGGTIRSVRQRGYGRHGGAVDGGPGAVIKLGLALSLDHALAGAYQAILMTGVALIAGSLVSLGWV